MAFDQIWPQCYQTWGGAVLAPGYGENRPLVKGKYLPDLCINNGILARSNQKQKDLTRVPFSYLSTLLFSYSLIPP